MTGLADEAMLSGLFHGAVGSERIGWDVPSTIHRRDTAVWYASRCGGMGRLAWKRWICRNGVEGLNLSTRTEIATGRAVPHCLSIDHAMGRYLLIGGVQGTVSLYDLIKTDSRPFSVKRTSIAASKSFHDRNTVSSVTWFPSDAGVFLTTSVNGKVNLMDVKTFTPVVHYTVPSFHGSDTPVWSAAFQPSGGHSLVSLAYESGQVGFWDLRTPGDHTRSINAHSLGTTSVSWHPCEPNQFASSGRDGGIKVWDIRRMSHSKPLLTLDWTQDHTTQRNVAEENAPRWSEGFTAKVEAARAHSKAVMSLRYTPCGRFLISAGNDREVRLWKSDTGANIPHRMPIGRDFRLPFRIEFVQTGHPDDVLLLFPFKTGRSVDDRLGLWSPFTSSDKPITELEGHSGSILSAVYRRADSSIYSCATDHLVLVWDSFQKSSQREAVHQRERTRVVQSPLVLQNVEQLAPSLPPPPPTQQETVSALNTPFIPPIVRAFMEEADQALRSATTHSNRPVASSIPTGAINWNNLDTSVLSQMISEDTHTTEGVVHKRARRKDALISATKAYLERNSNHPS